MSDINDLKLQLGAEIEALVAEIRELKERVSKLETEQFRAGFNNKKHIGQWVGRLKPSKKDFIG